MEKYNDIKSVVEGMEKDVQAFFEKGNKAAGTRVRKAALELKNLAHEIRQQVSSMKNQ
jgi:hypothetical protein